MAFIEMDFASGGGSETSTTLWSNNSTSFPERSITLSDSVLNYKRIRITAKAKNGDLLSEELTSDEIMKVNTSSYGVRFAFVGLQANVGAFSRNFYMNSDTSIKVSACYKINASATDNTEAIPIKVEGIK